MEKIIDDFKRFMGIDAFPKFEIEHYVQDYSKDYVYGAQAVYDPETKKHRLRLPSEFEVPRFLMFHELTHIIDAERYSTGEKNHDFCLHGFTEYHASQVELMLIMGAETISNSICFSMKDPFNNSEWSIGQYVDNKLETARKLILSTDRQRRVDGLGTLYNYLGLRSICRMYSSDYSDQYDDHIFLDTMSSAYFATLKNFMTGWVTDVEKAIGLYSNIFNAVVSW